MDLGALASLLQAGIPLAVVLLIAAVMAFTAGRVFSKSAMDRQIAETDRERREKDLERQESDRWIAIAFQLVTDGKDLKRGALDALTEAKARLPERRVERAERRDHA